MYRDRLLALAEHLEYGTLGIGWNFTTLITDCGTAGCALGHCPDLWPRDWKTVKDKLGRHILTFTGNCDIETGNCDIETGASEFFGINADDVNTLFFRNSWRNVPKLDIVKRIRSYVTQQDELRLMEHVTND